MCPGPRRSPKINCKKHLLCQRFYLFRGGSLEQLTDDDTLPSLLAAKGINSELEARHHPARKQLVAALGVEEFPFNKEVRVIDIEDGDQILLCSDGLTRGLKPADIQLILKSRDHIRDVVQQLVSEAVIEGSTDDITCVLLRVHETPVPTRQAPPSNESKAGLWEWLYYSRTGPGRSKKSPR